MTEVARILLDTPADCVYRRVLVFTPAANFPWPSHLVDELPETPGNEEDELYLLVDQDLEHCWYLVVDWDCAINAWCETYDPDTTEPEGDLNTDDFKQWHVRECAIPVSVRVSLS